jgi:predicted ATPase
LTTWLLGYPDQAICLSRDAIILAQELGHAMSLVLAHCFASFLHQFRAEPQAVLDRAEAVLEICTEQGIAPHYDATGRIMRGWAIAELGQPQAGAEEMRESLADLAATEMNARRPHYLSMLAEAEVLAGHAERGLSALAEAEVLIKRTGERRWEAEVYRLTGELLDVSGASGAEVEACFQRALETAAGQQARSLQLRAATSLARQWQKSNKEREAFGLLAPVYDWFEEGFETADLKAAKTLLDEF